MSQKTKKLYEETMRDFTCFLDFPWENKECYASWLAQTYFFVDNSTRIIAQAGSLFSKERDAFHRRFIDHAAEEKGHEKLLIRDLKDLGYTLEDFKVFPETKAFFQVQHYWIEKMDPSALFGYILTLEGLAFHYGKIATDRVVAAYKGKASSFLRVHAEEDQEHIDKALKLVAEVSPAEEKYVLENFELSSHFYKKILEQIQLAHAKLKNTSVA